MEDYVAHCYSMKNYKKAYSGIICPMNNHELWEKSQYIPTHIIRPPKILKQTGRPQKKRKLSQGEEAVIKYKDGANILKRKNQLTVR